MCCFAHRLYISPTRRAFLAYRVVAGTALVSGDPVGDDAEIDALLAEGAARAGVIARETRGAVKDSVGFVRGA